MNVPQLFVVYSQWDEQWVLMRRQEDYKPIIVLFLEADSKEEAETEAANYIDATVKYDSEL